MAHMQYQPLDDSVQVDIPSMQAGLSSDPLVSLSPPAALAMQVQPGAKKSGVLRSLQDRASLSPARPPPTAAVLQLQLAAKKNVVLRALKERTVLPGTRLRRTVSFAGITPFEAERRQRALARVEATKLALAAAKVSSVEASKVSRLLQLLLFQLILLLAYCAYRAIGCSASMLDWECAVKSYQIHWDHLQQLFIGGGVLFATGPTTDVFLTLKGGRRGGMIFTPIAVMIASMFTFAALGESPLLMISLASSGSWKPPAVYIIAGAIGCGVWMVAYSLWISRSAYELTVSLAIIVLLALTYSSAAIVAFVLGAPGTVPFHPHHWLIAFHLSLLLRNSSDPPSVLIRWLLYGVMVQGLSAYGPASMLDDGSS